MNYVIPKSQNVVQKVKLVVFLMKLDFNRKVCYKVSLSQNFEQKKCEKLDAELS